MSQKINCPYHEDNTASCHVYEDHFWCYGCGANGSLDKLSGKAPVFKNAFRSMGRPENLDQALERISKLPKKEIRGLMLPYDQRGYYTVYDAAMYYVLRRWDGDNTNKYVGPYGHRKPLFEPYPNPGFEPLLVIEGQLNALSAAKLYTSMRELGDVVSPGAATDFLKPMVLEYCLQYDKICLIVDKDAAGVAAGIQLRDKLVKAGKRVVLYPMDRDMNQVLCEDGQEGVKAEISKALELFTVQTGPHVPGSEPGVG